jgi:hypothetical protein
MVIGNLRTGQDTKHGFEYDSANGSLSILSGGNPPAVARIGLVRPVQPHESTFDRVSATVPKASASGGYLCLKQGNQPCRGDHSRPDEAAPDRTTTSHKDAGVTIFAIAEDFFDFPMGNDPTRKAWH